MNGPPEKKLLITTLQNKPVKMNNYLVLPYVPELTHDLERVFRKFDIQIAYDSSGKLEDLLGNQKQKTSDMEKSGIYWKTNKKKIGRT